MPSAIYQSVCISIVVYLKKSRTEVVTKVSCPNEAQKLWERSKGFSRSTMFSLSCNFGACGVPKHQFRVALNSLVRDWGEWILSCKISFAFSASTLIYFHAHIDWSPSYCEVGMCLIVIRCSFPAFKLHQTFMVLPKLFKLAVLDTTSSPRFQHKSKKDQTWHTLSTETRVSIQLILHIKAQYFVPTSWSGSECRLERQ